MVLALGVIAEGWMGVGSGRRGWGEGQGRGRGDEDGASKDARLDRWRFIRYLGIFQTILVFKYPAKERSDKPKI